MPLHTLNYFDTTSTFGLSLVFFNSGVYVCLLYTFFYTLLLFNVAEFKTLSSLKGLGRLNVATITTIMTFLSIAGIPPLIGFVGKFLILNFLLFKQFFYFMFLFSFVNFFTLYFYLQCLRFLISKDQTNVFILLNSRVFLNKSVITSIILLNLFNFFGILLFSDLFFWFFCLALQKDLF